ncbi:MAG: methyltransferase [Gemmatimonadota bacterium]
MTDDVTRLWEKLDLMTPMAIRVAASLRISDLIAEGHDHLPELAAGAGAHPDALGRLLRHLTARGVFDEPEPDRFALNDLAAVLLDGHSTATRRWLDLEGFGGRMDLAFFDLLATVRDGRPPESGHKAELPEAIQASYDDVMESQSRAQAGALVAGYDWEGVRQVVDLGGGTGTLLIELLESRPEIRARLVELSGTAERARQVVEEAGLSERCEVIPGDLFEVTPEGADVYVLKFVLHSLEDDQAEEALRRCRQAGGADCRVLVIESTVEPGADRSQFTAMDLRMLILGHGRERTLDEYAALAGKAGLRLSTAIPTTTGAHLIELRSSG